MRLSGLELSIVDAAGHLYGDRGGQQVRPFFTGQVTAAGKVLPGEVLVIGGASLALAIGVATSLDARTYAFVLLEVAEQIESIGAKFVYLDFDSAKDGVAARGYAAGAGVARKEACSVPRARHVIIPGRDAPRL